MTSDDMVVTPMGLRFQGRVWPCTVGRSGIVRGSKKREGDGGTPSGVHRIVGCLYRPDRVARSEVPDWAVPIRLGDLWCDDPESEDYNLMVRAPFAASHERLWRSDPMYDVILVTDWNWPAARGRRGSAIFVHTWRRPGAPTAGCVALARENLLAMLPAIKHRTRLVVPEGPSNSLSKALWKP